MLISQTSFHSGFHKYVIDQKDGFISCYGANWNADNFDVER